MEYMKRYYLTPVRSTVR